MSGALAAFPIEGELDASSPQNEEPAQEEANGPILGASWGVAIQEILLWPIALAVAFAWIVQL